MRMMNQSDSSSSTSRVQPRGAGVAAAALAFFAVAAACTIPIADTGRDRLADKATVDAADVANVLQTQLQRFGSFEVDFWRTYTKHGWSEKKEAYVDEGRQEDFGVMKMVRPRRGQAVDFKMSLRPSGGIYGPPDLKRVDGVAYREVHADQGWKKADRDDMGAAQFQFDALTMTDLHLYAVLARAGTVTSAQSARGGERRYEIRTDLGDAMATIDPAPFYLYIVLAAASAKEDPLPLRLMRQLTALANGKAGEREAEPVRKQLSELFSGDTATLTVQIDDDDRVTSANLHQTARGETEMVKVTLSQWGRVTIESP